MKLIVGLGNPGKNYENTRHNSGFRVVDFYAKNNNLVFKNKFNGEYAECTLNGEKYIFLKPQTFMNLSGECVSKFVNYFNINLEDILVIYDDVNFEVGSFRVKRDGSDGGHNGIKNIILNLKTEKIQRIKIGISKNEIPMVDYVLGHFTKEDNEKLNNMFPTIEKIINDFSKMTIDQIMNKYNGKNE